MKKLNRKQKDRQNVDADVVCVLKLLPVTILALIAVLSLEEREVIAYMITRLMKTTFFIEDGKKKCKPKKVPFFQCGCFDCYKYYWFKWDSSPNRDLIHQAIEAYEEHLSQKEKLFNTRGGKKNKNKKTHKMAHSISSSTPVVVEELITQEKPQLDDDDGFQLCGSDEAADDIIIEEDYDDCKLDEEEEEEVTGKLTENVMDDLQVAGLCCSSSHKGFARKVLPDVLDLFNSRLWSLWGTAV